MEASEKTYCEYQEILWTAGAQCCHYWELSDKSMHGIKGRLKSGKQAKGMHLGTGGCYRPPTILQHLRCRVSLANEKNKEQKMKAVILLGEMKAK